MQITCGKALPEELEEAFSGWQAKARVRAGASHRCASLKERDDLAGEIALGGVREGRCLRLISAFGETSRGGQVAEPTIGVAEIQRVGERRPVPHVDRRSR